MGKATRWLRRLWTGKKEEKELKPKPGDDKRVFHAADTDQLQRARAIAAADAALAAAKAAAAAARLAISSRAAVKIQTAFRSHLARKALRALRALVKLQALVRGYLVRRQAAAALRGIQALIRAQEKARLRRLGLVGRDNSARFDSPKIVEIDPGTPGWRFPSLQVSLSDYGEEYRRCSTVHCTPRLVKPGGGELAGYMAKTRSFEAKARSLSAPKQRPEPLVEKKRLSVCERRERRGEPLEVKEEMVRGLSSPGKLGQRWRGRYR